MTIEAALANGRLIDLILVLVALEAVVLIGIYRFSGRGLPPAQVLAFLASGACLMVALKAALLQSGWMMVALALGGAGVAHVADLWLRWRSPRV